MSEREDEILSELEGDRDFLEYLQEQLGAMKETKHNEEYRQVLTVTRLTKSERRLEGIIETGQYGTETNIYSVPKKQVVYKRQRQEADLWPFYFMFDIPEGRDEGLLILQRTGNYGIRKVLYRFLRESFLNDFEDLRLLLDPIVDPEQVQKYEHGAVQELRFVKLSLPADLADRLDTPHKEVRGKMELVIKAQRGGSLPFKKYVAGLFRKREQAGVFAIDGGTFAYNDIKLRARVGGTSRTFSISDPKLRSYYDVTSAISIGAGGHPTFESISKSTDELTDRLHKLMY